MHKANLYWIDDSSKHMMSIVDKVFPLLWNENLSCISILFGNAYCAKVDELGPDDHDCAALSDYIENQFVCYCQELDNYYWKELGDTYKEKKELLIRPATMIIPLGGTVEGTSNGTIRGLVKNWTDDNILKDFQAEVASTSLDNALAKFQMSVDTLINEMKIPDQAPIALDIYLLYGDGNRVQNDLPTLSMVLYNALSTRHPCYLYSEMAVSQTLVDKWKKIYSGIFQSDNFEIYPKTGLITVKKETEAKRDLIKMVTSAKEKST